VNAGAPDVSIVIPAFDEVDRIESTIDEVAGLLDTVTPAWELIVVADGGPPALGDAARRAVGRWPRARLEVNDTNRGKGYAVRRGVLGSRGRVVGFLDADLAQPVEALPSFLAAVDAGASVAIGVRQGADGATSSPVRRLASTAFAGLARTMLGLPFRDLQCGMKVFEGEAGRALFRAQHLDRFAFDSEVLMIARRWGLRIVEVPVVVRPQTSSTVRVVRDGSHMVAELARVRWNVMRGRYDRGARPA
jgi:glycosyltransferase involved in cell wall biosynthesis